MRTSILFIAALSLFACHKDQATKSATAQPTSQPAPESMASMPSSEPTSREALLEPDTQQAQSGPMSQRAEAETNPTSAPSSEPTSATATNFEPILFKFNEASLSDEAMDSLNQLAAYLFDHPDIGVVISGYTDERGTAEYNLALGDERARVAKDYLTRLGIDPSRIAIVSYGEENPVASGSDEEAWSKNRRSEFKIVRKEEVRASR